MRIFSWLVILIAAHSSLLAEDSLSVGYQKSIQLVVPGATAAYSLDSVHVEASAEGGMLSVYGRNPGVGRILVVIGDEIRSYRVEVLSPPKVVPPWLKAQLRERSMDSASGNFSSRYISDQAVFYNTISFRRRQGARTTEMLVNVGTRFRREYGVPAGLPIGYYKVRWSGKEVSVLDKQVQLSPLTIDGTTLRGLYVDTGRWFFEGGYTSFSTFENVFLPAATERVLALGYRHSLSNRSKLTPQLLYLPGGSPQQRGGTVGSLLWDRRLGEHWAVVSEIAYGRGLATSTEILYKTDAETFRASFRNAPKDFVSLGLNSYHGRFGNIHWTRRTEKLGLSVLFSSNLYNRVRSKQQNTVANAALHYNVLRNWRFGIGAAHTSFRSYLPVESAIRTFRIPSSVAFHSKHFGASMAYQHSYNGDHAVGGRQIRSDIRLSSRAWSLGLTRDSQTQAITVSSIVSQIPGLQQTLDQLGISATTPEQLVELLQRTSILTTLGLAPQYAINLSPSRTQYVANLGWSIGGRRAQRFSAQSIYDTIRGASSDIVTIMHIMSWQHRLGESGELAASYSYSSMEQIATHSKRLGRVLSISFRRDIGGAPRFVIPERTGSVSGVVFLDETHAGKQQAGSSGILNAEVILDGSRRARTDANGRFRFSGVPFGEHEVEVRYQGKRPHFFTTPSVAKLVMNQTAAFGIAFSSSRLFGSVRNDAGIGIGGAEVRIEKDGQVWTGATDADGRFSFENLSEGEYQVSVNPASLPAGYALDRLSSQTVLTNPEHPGRVVFTCRALRLLAGNITAYDRLASKQVPVAGVVVQLDNGRRRTVTDKEGNFLFRDVSPGVVTISAAFEGREQTQTVEIPAQPASTRCAFDLGAVINVRQPERPPNAAPAPEASAKPEVEPPKPAQTTQPVAEMNPPDRHAAEVYHARGREFIRIGDFEKAIDVLGRSIQADKQLAVAHNARGFAYLQLRRIEEACADFRAALDIRPDYENARTNLDAAIRIQKLKAGRVPSRIATSDD